MVRRHNRLLVAFHVVTDAVLGMIAFFLAYLLRFETGLIAITRGHPPIEQYINVLPFIALIVPLGFHFQGLYRLRRGRSRIDDFFNVLVGSIFAVVLGIVATLYFQAYYATEAQRDVGAFEVSRIVWGIFLVCNIALGYLSRKFIREALERRWLAGIGLRRILIAGAGDLGRVVADRILEHRELGYQIVGFVDDKAGGDHLGYRGLPLLGSLSDAADIVTNEKIDDLYVALPLEEHMKLLDLVESTSREGVDVKVVPDLLQFIALRARLEDLDGVPVINLNDVPLQGISAFIKRVLDIVISAGALAVMAVPGLVISWMIKRSSPGPIFYAQERMGLDGKQFTRLQVPHDADRRRDRHRADLGRRERQPRHARSARSCAATISTSGRSSGTCWSATCRSSDRGPSGRSSSSSSSTASRSTCCATRSRPASPAGRRSTAGAATRRSKSASSTTCITSRTGR